MWGNVECHMRQLFIFFLSCLITIDVSSGLKCYQCGEYTDGIGSITPCTNYTDEKHLKQCLDEGAQCIKYVMDASIVRGCFKNCIEKEEKWGTRTYCCTKDACNSSSALETLSASISTFVILIFICLV